MGQASADLANEAECLGDDITAAEKVVLGLSKMSPRQKKEKYKLFTGTRCTRDLKAARARLEKVLPSLDELADHAELRADVATKMAYLRGKLDMAKKTAASELKQVKPNTTGAA